MSPIDIDERSDEEVVGELFGVLRGDDALPPEALPDKTIRKVEASITSRDLVDLVTFVFMVRFCAPLIDMIAALFGHTPERDDRRRNHE